MGSQPVHRSILAIDIEGSTAAVRTNPVRHELRSCVYRMLAVAMSHTGIDGHRCDPLEDRGDGVLVLIHPVDELPKTLLLTRLVPALTRQLVEYNASVPPAELPRLGLRLRAVVHAGEVHRDENGYFGEEVDLACRLLDAQKLKRCLRSCASPLVLVVSEDIYWGIVRHGYDGICPATYRPELSVMLAGRRRRGFVHFPSALQYSPPEVSIQNHVA